MYGVLLNKDLIALHDDKEVVEDFVKQQKNDNLTIIKIKKKKSKIIQDSIEYQELYLVRYGHEYVPYEYYSTLKDINEQYTYDIKYCRDILYRLLEDDSRSEKDLKAITRTISILMDELSSSSNLGILELKTISDLNKEYKSKI